MTASDLHPTDASTTDASTDVFVLVAAYNEADRIAATINALVRAFPGAGIWVADDGSSDGTAAIAERAGATVVSSGRVIGKGGAVTLAARAALADARALAGARVLADGWPRAAEADASAGTGALAARRSKSTVLVEPVAVLCDGDLGDSAALLGPLVGAVRGGEVDLAVAAFARRVGGGLGLAVGFAGWAIRRRCGIALRAPISGQRALRLDVLERVLPFAHGFGMEIGMTIDAARAGARVRELDLDLSHRATGRTWGGFLHRGRQLVDFVRVYCSRR
jgi:glycosyltransferase involved in cell wall biosynthesis